MRSQVLNWMALLALGVGVSGCGGDGGQDGPATLSIPGDAPEAGAESLDGIGDPEEFLAHPEVLATPPTPPDRDELYPEVRMKTSLGEIQLRLNAEKAPQTVDNFLENYVERGFYENTIFHYIEDGFIAIAGGYTPDLEPKATRAPIRSEAHNGLKNLRGTIAMSRQVDYADSGTSQFFINLSDNPNLDHDPEGGDQGFGYCVFGEVIAGQEVVDAISQAKVEDRGEFLNVPVTSIVIESVERFYKTSSEK